MLEQKLFQLLDAGFEEIVAIRRHLHQYPELSFQEVKTPAYIASFHEKLGHEVKRNVGERGVVAVLKGGKLGPTIALRADFDALPIQEETGLPFASKVDGVMHACGHDGHTATLLGLARALNQLQEEIKGTIVFIHQHAEEYAPGGAIAMIQDGCLDGVDVIFGTHLWATIPYGEVQYRKGPIMSAVDRFEIVIHGQGGHAGTPHLTKDAIVIGANVVTQLQQVVSRRIDPMKPAVVSIGSFEAMNAFNVIADEAKIVGTVRTFHEEVRDEVEKEIKHLVHTICDSAHAKATVTYERGYPAVVNHSAETDFLRTCAQSISEVKRTEEMEPMMGGEDFAYYLQHVKGTFFFTGAKNPAWDVAYPHHHPKFDIDERAMLIAAKVLGKAALHYPNIAREQ